MAHFTILFLLALVGSDSPCATVSSEAPLFLFAVPVDDDLLETGGVVTFPGEEPGIRASRHLEESGSG